ncbi:MAG: aromatic ring-hydroxylating dioxygenase subunit alpha [Haliea sp.]|nr:aromatic ring-hydroxylating dioxygenase subunit alpha [Haliea sp.]
MNRATINSINRRLLENLRNNTTDMAASETRIAASEFYCPDILAAERQHLFINTPQPVAFSGELPGPGSYLALQMLDIPVLLTRDERGQLRAFINACSHRGARVASGSGQARSLVCPFHGWAYALDGALRGRPEDGCFSTPVDDCALTPLAVSEKYGVVVVALTVDGTQHAVDSALDEIGEHLEGIGFQHYRALERRHFDVAANWKLVSDLSLESYHFKTLHRDSVARILAANAVVDTFGRHSLWAFPFKSIAQLGERDEDSWPDTVQGSCTFTLYPGVMFVVNSLGAQMIRAEPGAGPGESRVTFVGVSGPGCDVEQARQAWDFGGEVFEREDLPIAEDCQRGLVAGRRDQLLGRNEPLLHFWHQLWRAALS